MKQKDKKLVVLHQLSQEAEPISLPNLLDKLGNQFNERTTRRWLTEMIKEGLVERSGSKRSTLYRVVIRTNRYTKATTTDGYFGTESAKVLEKVRRPIYARKPSTYNDDWLDAYRPNDHYYIPLSTQTQLYQAGKRCRQEDPAGTYAHQIYNRLLIDLSYNSSRLEGNTYSLLDTERLVIEGESAEGKLDEEKIMILNHKEAIRHLVDTAQSLEVTKHAIHTLHYLLSDGLVEPKYAGKVRDHGVRIGGSTYIPYEDQKILEARLEMVIQKAAQIKNPFEQSFFLLVHITYLQAFTDVNKRTARLSANIPLIKSNLVPLSFNDVEREDYTSAVIAIYEHQDTRPLLDLYQFSYLRTCAFYDSTIKAMGFDEVRVRYRQQRRSLIGDIIQRKLHGPTMDEFIKTQTQKFVKEEDRVLFTEDVMEDLREIDESRIVGLGITRDQLKAWKEH